jgi:formate dehydrogenase subunit delta
VRLAGDIADQFRHKPEELAAEAVANHIKMFWDPRMRVSLRAAHVGGELDDQIVARAAAILEV